MVCAGRAEGFELGPVIQRMLQVPVQTPQCSLCWDSTNTTQIVAEKWGGHRGTGWSPHSQFGCSWAGFPCWAVQANLPAPAGCTSLRILFKSKSNHKSSAQKDGKCVDTQQPPQPKRCLRVAARICHYLTLQSAFLSLLLSSEWGEKDLQCREKWD